MGLISIIFAPMMVNLKQFFFLIYNVNEQTALNNSTSGAAREPCSNKNFRHFAEMLRNSSLLNTSFVFAEIISTHFSFNFLSVSQSIVYWRTEKTFSALRLSNKNASHWWISECIKYFFARKDKKFFNLHINSKNFPCFSIEFMPQMWRTWIATAMDLRKIYPLFS